MYLIATTGTELFEDLLLALGGLLMVGALISGLARRSFLSLTAAFVLTGFILGDGGLKLLDFDPTSTFVSALAIIALVVILFRDGLHVDAEMLPRAWALPLRKLIVAMPITCVIIAVGAKLLTNFSWTEAFLLGALLSPTDPVLTSSVISNPRVPRLARHSLNLESGLNDGLALPAVLALLASLAGSDDFVWWKFVLQDLTVGFAFGLGIGWIASKVMPRKRWLTREIPEHQKALFVLGVAFLTYGLTTGIPPKGNGFIAVFVCAVVLGMRRPDLRATFENRSDEIVELVKLAVFVVFGSLLTVSGLFGDGWSAVAIVIITLLLARPVAIWIALLGTRLPNYVKAFMAWFGPKGVATMAFSLLVLGQSFPNNARIFNIAALCVFASVFLHGLTDTPGVNWISRRTAAAKAQRTSEEGVGQPLT